MLRTRLDKLGYLDFCSPESSTLVLKLLNDLIQTTESCKKLKNTMDLVQNDKQQLEGQVNRFYFIIRWSH